jgi:hypothetical protein
MKIQRKENSKKGKINSIKKEKSQGKQKEEKDKLRY